jgi:hypothetical protein
LEKGQLKALNILAPSLLLKEILTIFYKNQLNFALGFDGGVIKLLEVLVSSQKYKRIL